MPSDTQTDRYGSLAWFEIHVSDIDRAGEFYGKVFDWTFEPIPGFPLGEYLMIATRSGAPVGGGLAKATGRSRPGGESCIVYLNVEDVQIGLDAAVAAGAKIHQPRMNIGGSHGYCAIVEDPEGNLVGLWADR